MGNERRVVARIRGDLTEFAVILPIRSEQPNRVVTRDFAQFEASQHATENRGVGGSIPPLAISGISR
jgi:hypothetical protein